MRLILIRHGETDYNRGGITLGRADVPLNERGRLQARAIAASFDRLPGAIYSSPLSRALDTAQAIATSAGPIPAVDEGLIEMDVGDLEHLTSGELRQRYPEFLSQWLGPGCADARMPGGETLSEVQDRVWASVGRMREKSPDGVVLAITHNFVILTLVCRALNLPLAEFRRLRQALAAKTILEIGEERSALLQLNDDAHLRAAGLSGDATERKG